MDPACPQEHVTEIWSDLVWSRSYYLKLIYGRQPPQSGLNVTPSKLIYLNQPILYPALFNHAVLPTRLSNISS